MRLVILVLATVLLSGCWESQGLFLDTRQAVYPFSQGTYYDQSNTPTTVSIDGNGWYVIDEHKVLVNRLGVGANGLTSYVYAALLSNDVYAYGLLYVENGGAVVHKVQPDCDSAYDQQIYQRAGNYIDRSKDGVTSCYFSSRESAFTALRALSQDNSYANTSRYIRYERR